MPTHGEELIERCKEHTLETLQTVPESAPNDLGSDNDAGASSVAARCCDNIAGSVGSSFVEASLRQTGRHV